ncbi:MAG: helix-turn-helix domain-containing protein [Clostridium sp.]|nr:helix-turn-helix domain-containing protein [Clostridium sp.]
MKINTSASNLNFTQKEIKSAERVISSVSKEKTDYFDFNESYKSASRCLFSLRRAEISFGQGLEKRPPVSETELRALVDSGIKSYEICEKLNISPNQYKYLIKKYGIITARKAAKSNVASVSKENFLSLVQSGMSVKEICKSLNISLRTYSNLLKRFDIETEYQKTLKHNAQITKEELVALVGSGKSVSEICEILGITSATYVNYLERFQIQTNQKELRNRVASVSKEQLVDLIEQGKTKIEICEQLGISSSSFNRLVNKYEITTSQKASMQKNASVTKEQLETLIKEGKSNREIYDILGISKSAYSKLLNKYGIKTETMLRTEKVASIKKETVIALMNQGKSAYEIIKELGISAKAYYKLLRKFDIDVKKYSVKSNDENLQKQVKVLHGKGKSPNEIADELKIDVSMCYYILNKLQLASSRSQLLQKSSQISREQLLDVISEGKSMQENIKKLGITESSYYTLLKKYNILTETQKVRNRLAKISVEQISSLLSDKKSCKEVCDELNLSYGGFYDLMNKLGVVSKRRLERENIASVTKERLLECIEKQKTIKNICKELNISTNSYFNLMMRYSIPYGREKKDLFSETSLKKKYDEYSVSELKERTLELFVMNDFINENEQMLAIVDYIDSKETFDSESKQILTDFVKLLDSVHNGNTDKKDIFNAPSVVGLSCLYKAKVEEEIEKQRNFEALVMKFYGVMEKLSKNNMSDVVETCYKYFPHSQDDEKLEDAQSIMNIIKDCLSNSENSVQDLYKLKCLITYFDSLKNSSESADMKDAREFSMKTYGKIVPEKIGQYLTVKNVYKKYLKDGDSDVYPKEYLEIIQSKTTQSENILKYMMKFDRWLNSDISSQNHISDFVNIFTPDRRIDNAIIKNFIENTYLNEDTIMNTTCENGRSVESKLSKDVKREIYQKYKYPNCLEFFIEIENAMKTFAPPKGTSGIKQYIRGKGKVMEIKLIGYPDRIYSSANDYCFDVYSEKGNHK